MTRKENAPAMTEAQGKTTPADSTALPAMPAGPYLLEVQHAKKCRADLATGEGCTCNPDVFMRLIRGGER